MDINSFNSNKKKSGKGKIEYVYADITDEDQMKEKIRYIQKKYKKIDILINNASIDYKPKKNLENSSFEETTLENWLYEINVGLTGAFICSKLISKYMINRKSGIILNISSDLSVIAPDQRLYSHLNSFKPVTYTITPFNTLSAASSQPI